MPTLRASLLTLASLALLLFVTACDSNDPADDGAGEEEVISNLTLTLTGGAQPVTAEAVFDAGGTLQSVETLTLTPGVAYAGTIEFQNRFADEPEEQNITAEVRAEAVEHQVFYAPDDALAGDVTVTVTDQETDYSAEIEGDDVPRSGVPVGLTYRVVVADSPSGSGGTLRIVLGHYDEREKTADESIDAVPEIDVDVDVPVAFN